MSDSFAFVASPFHVASLGSFTAQTCKVKTYRSFTQLEHANTKPTRHQTLDISMKGPKSIAARERKEAIVQDVKNLLDANKFVAALPLEGYTVNQVYKLRSGLPEGVKAMAVKNTLMDLAIKESSEWQAINKLTTTSNLFLFAKEDQIRDVYDYVVKFHKETKIKKEIKGSVFDNEYYNEDGTKTLSKLPTKQELIAKIALAIKMVPTKIGKGIKLVPTNIGKGIRLALMDEGPDKKEGEGEAAAE